MFGLPFSTFAFVILVPLVAIALAILYAVTFQDTDTWWTFDKIKHDGKDNKK